jgi:photosystem II stability/assembly factor-like uncharacterized protein
MSPDDFERQLRDVLHSRRLSISPPPDALERIHTGAKRRRRRQHALTSGVAAIAVIGLAVAGVALRPSRHTGTTTADGPASTSVSRSATGGSVGVATPSVEPTTSAPAPSSIAALRSEGSVATAATIPAAGPPPAGFVPISVTAVNATTFWVLGHAPCGDQTCTGIAKSTDAGKTFTEVGAPASTLVPDVPGNNDVYGVNTISDVRFVDANNGWAFGGGLWQTTDAGDTWSFVAMPGPVQRLEVASGRAWAVVLSDASAATGPTYDVYSSTYPGGSWQKASSAGTFGPSEPSLAVQGTTAIVIGTDASSAGVRAVEAGSAAAFTALGTPPCAGAPGEPLSSSATSLWLACTSSANKLQGVFFSPDFGKSWQGSSSKLDATMVAIGAVDGKSAIVSDGGKLVRHTDGKSVETVSQPAVPALTVFAFVGFTTPDAGFAIPEVDGVRQLWRTDDGGAHWAVVKI